MSRPVVNSNESPGRTNPINRPDSANTAARIPISPKVEISHSALRTFTRHGPFGFGMRSCGRGQRAVGTLARTLWPTTALTLNAPEPKRPSVPGPIGPYRRVRQGGAGEVRGRTRRQVDEEPFHDQILSARR